MKVLYLSPRGYDFLPDQLYTGLCSLHGTDAVVDFPWKPEYHDPAHRIAYLPQNSGRPHELDEVTAMLERRVFDLVVLTAQRRGTLEAYASLRDRVALPPMAFIDSSDSPDMQGDLFRRLGGALYFKREYRWLGRGGPADHWARWRQFGTDRDLFDRTHPLQMSAILETVPASRTTVRDLDLSFYGFVSNRKRIRAVELLRQVPGIAFQGGVYGDTKTRRSKTITSRLGILRAKLQGDPYLTEADCGTKLGYDEHYQVLHRSKMGLSLAGSGFDTMRYWEIPATQALLISEQPSINIPHNFEHGMHALFCKPDLSDLVPLVRTYLHDAGARESLAKAGYEHLLAHHTCDRRAAQFLDVCRARL